MGDVLAELFTVLIAAWLVLGPLVLIAISSRVHGAKKMFWAACALAPIILVILGVVVAINLYPESPLHLHSNHLPAGTFFSLVGVWGVYIAFRRRYIAVNEDKSRC